MIGYWVFSEALPASTGLVMAQILDEVSLPAALRDAEKLNACALARSVYGMDLMEHERTPGLKSGVRLCANPDMGSNLAYIV